MTETEGGDEQEELESDVNFTAYQWHANTLRTWFVAYGIGAPVLFLTQEKVWAKFSQSDYCGAVAGLFLTGVGLQVLLAMLNKTIMWLLYFGSLEPETRAGRWWHLAADRVSEWIWLDILVDLVSFAAFAAATVLAFRVLV
jgi:hypothetical protein